MAFDKQHITELKSEILLVETLGNEIGYLVLLNIAIAIFKAKDNNEKHHYLKKHLTEIIDNIENHNEDYYNLVNETINNKTNI